MDDGLHEAKDLHYGSPGTRIGLPLKKDGALEKLGQLCGQWVCPV